MCIIVYKPKTKKLPSKKILKTCFNNNNNGAGFMYNDNDNVIIQKGYMAFDELYDDLKKIDISKDVVIHFRIGTQGANTYELTHPFDLFNVYDLAKKITTKIGVAHNGIITLDSCKSSTFSDTQLFTDLFLKKFYKIDKHFYKKDKWQELIVETTGSKMVIFDKNGAYMIGDFILDNDIYYSNGTYKNYVLSVQNGYKHQYNYSDFNDDYYYKSTTFDDDYKDYTEMLDLFDIKREDYPFDEYDSDSKEAFFDDYCGYLLDNGFSPKDLSYTNFVVSIMSKDNYVNC